MATTKPAAKAPAAPTFESIVAGSKAPQLASELTEEEKEALEEPVVLDSSMLESVYYEPDNETLTAIFNNDAEESYECSVQQYRELVTSASPGKFMWENFL